MKTYYKLAIIVSPVILVSVVCMNPFLLKLEAVMNKQFNFVAVGDLDCNNNSIQTINNSIDKKPELFLAIGDLYYNCKPEDFKKMLSSLNDILYMRCFDRSSPTVW